MEVPAPGITIIRTSRSRQEWIWSELLAGRVHQGWGFEGTDLLDETGFPLDRHEWQHRYAEALARRGGTAAGRPDDPALRYRILSQLLKVRAGDLILLPHLPHDGSFTLVRAAGSYRFDRSHFETYFPDFGHVIPVDPEPRTTYRHDSVPAAAALARRFGYYPAGVSPIADPHLRAVIHELFRGGNPEPSPPSS